MSNWFHTMKHSARDDLYRNVLPLPYRVQIHMNLRDHRRPSVSQVSLLPLIFFCKSHTHTQIIQIVFRWPCHNDGTCKKKSKWKFPLAKHANLLTISLHSLIISRRYSTSYISNEHILHSSIFLLLLKRCALWQYLHIINEE